METIQQVLQSLDCSKKDKRKIGQRINHALKSEEPLEIFVGSCPDYSNDGNVYTFETIGDGVPLLSQRQLISSEALFASLNCLWRTV